MNDQERLEELINRKPSRWGNLTIKEFERDIKILQKQAEEKQELEEEYKVQRVELLEEHIERLEQEKQELEGVAKDRYRDWEKSEQQNKRYEEAFRRIKRDYAVQNVDYIPVTALYEIQLIIDQALQNNREG